MRILVASDLHFETHFDGGEGLCAIMGETPHDLAIVAGDLCTFKILKRSLRLISKTFREVIYILGNHECWDAPSMWKALWRARRECERLSNVHLLEDSTIEIGGVRFVGCTMWFRYPPPEGREAEWAMRDFERIGRFRREVGITNRMSVRFLERTVRHGDVVITHHLPGTFAVHPRWRLNKLNPYFVCDVERVIRKQKPALWINGHSHESMSGTIGQTVTLSNPFGYMMTSRGPDVNASFNPALIVEVG